MTASITNSTRHGVIRRLRAGLRGFIEFRSGVGLTYGDSRDDAYDYGRDLAHKLTLRKWDESAWDYCYSPQCERETVWDGEFCTRCGRQWGYEL